MELSLVRLSCRLEDGNPVSAPALAVALTDQRSNKAETQLILNPLFRRNGKLWTNSLGPGIRTGNGAAVHGGDSSTAARGPTYNRSLSIEHRSCREVDSSARLWIQLHS